MVIVPKTSHVLKPLNSYYVKLKRLVEHYQGDIGSGAIYLKSPMAEASLFFDKDNILNGVIRTSSGEENGERAIKRIFDTEDNNYEIHIYSIPEDEVYFWADIPNATTVYDELNSEFTNLDGLIKKLSTEKFTGYILANFLEGSNHGYVFLINGKIVHAFFSALKAKINITEKSLKLLKEISQKKPCVFQVKRIEPKKNTEKNGIEKEKNESKEGDISFSRAISFLEEVLRVLEKTITSNRKIKKDFKLILRNKFLEKAEEYPFLDPFAAQFEYDNGSIEFSGNESPIQLIKGISESIEEIAAELNITDRLDKEMSPLKERFPEVWEESSLTTLH